MRKNFKQIKKNTGLVPVIMAGGIPAKVNPAIITDEKWMYHHGKTAGGQQVNSMKTVQIGESILIQGNTGPILSVTMNEFEVAATQRLAALGYKLTPPNIGQ